MCVKWVFPIMPHNPTTDNLWRAGGKVEDPHVRHSVLVSILLRDPARLDAPHLGAYNLHLLWVIRIGMIWVFAYLGPLCRLSLLNLLLV